MRAVALRCRLLSPSVRARPAGGRRDGLGQGLRDLGSRPRFQNTSCEAPSSRTHVVEVLDQRCRGAGSRSSGGQQHLGA